MKLKDYKPQPKCVVKTADLSQRKRKVFDFHMHMGKLLLGENYQERYETNDFINQLKTYGIEGIVNLDGFWGDDLTNMLEKTQDHKDFIKTFIWIDTTKIDDEDFEIKTEKHIRESVKKGISGIKMWKDISLYQKDKKGQPIRTDDPRLSIVYNLAAEYHLPVLIHIADPVAFFDPVDANNERYEELQENPDWSFYGDKYMSFEALLEMQNNMIENHPNTIFVIAHVGSYAENLDYVSRKLDLYPNMYIDISARIAELARVPNTAKKFFTKHQDRILFGTDLTPISNLEEYESYFRFLETDDEYFPYSKGEPGQGRWCIYGLNLDDDILEKIYYKNALKILNKVK